MIATTVTINKLDDNAYADGAKAKSEGKFSNANPYFLLDLWKSFSWHAGWSEFDQSKAIENMLQSELISKNTVIVIND